MRPMLTYQLAISHPTSHIVEVTMGVPACPGTRTLSLPAWIPGSYMIRDFARHIIEIHARDSAGDSVSLTPIDKQSWSLAPSSREVQIHYRIYCFDFSVRGCYLTQDYGLLNGTGIFLCLEGMQSLVHCVSLTLPRGWKTATTLGQRDGAYEAKSYADLIDHPMLVGHFDSHTFTLGDLSVEMVYAGGHQADLPRISQDVGKLVAHHLALYQDAPPFDRYLFITLLGQNVFGGLEHRDSTALMFDRHALPGTTEQGQSEEYRAFLSLCAHELLHAWHVKRVRPKALLTPDLSKEVYTPQLWIYEGFTSYYDDLSLRRSGLISADAYLELLGQQLTRLLRNPGRRRQSVAQSSFYAWTKFYQQDDSAINNIVSYYNKGAIVALCLDLRLRQLTDNQQSLDDIMRHLWQTYGKDESGTDDEAIYEYLQSHCPALAEELRYWVDSTDELPVEACLKAQGVTLHRRARTNQKDKGGKTASEVIRHQLGAQVQNSEGLLKVTQVSENGPAYRAGVQTHDRLLALNDFQVNSETLQKCLDALPTGEPASLALFRDGRLLTLSLDVELADFDTLYLSMADSQKAMAWLTP